MRRREPEEGQDELQRSVGRRIAELRGAAGWTQEVAAAHIGIGWRRLQDIEAGTVNLTLRTLLRVANAFGVGAHELLTPGDDQRLGSNRK